jgi:hypothetical protein
MKYRGYVTKRLPMPTPPGFAPRTGLAIVLGDRAMAFIAEDEGLFRRTVDSKVKSGPWPDAEEVEPVDCT